MISNYRARRNYLGVVLAGGHSRRMGCDKALLPITHLGETNKITLFDYVLRRFERQIDNIIVSTQSLDCVFTSCGHDLVADTMAFEGLGPLSGLKAAFDYCYNLVPSCRYQAVITIAVDTPFFPENYVKQMLACASTNPKQAILAATINGHHPTFALWPLDLAELLEQHLQAGGRSIKSFAEHAGKQTVMFPLACVSPNSLPIKDPFFNINTRQEWQLVCRYL